MSRIKIEDLNVSFFGGFEDLEIFFTLDNNNIYHGNKKDEQYNSYQEWYDANGITKKLAKRTRKNLSVKPIEILRITLWDTISKETKILTLDSDTGLSTPNNSFSIRKINQKEYDFYNSLPTKEIEKLASDYWVPWLRFLEKQGVKVPKDTWSILSNFTMPDYRSSFWQEDWVKQLLPKEIPGHPEYRYKFDGEEKHYEWLVKLNKKNKEKEISQ